MRQVSFRNRRRLASKRFICFPLPMSARDLFHYALLGIGRVRRQVMRIKPIELCTNSFEVVASVLSSLDRSHTLIYSAAHRTVPQTSNELVLVVCRLPSSDSGFCVKHRCAREIRCRRWVMKLGNVSGNGVTSFSKSVLVSFSMVCELSPTSSFSL